MSMIKCEFCGCVDNQSFMNVFSRIIVDDQFSDIRVCQRCAEKMVELYRIITKIVKNN